MQYDLAQETDRLYMAIGKVVVSFQFVENLVGELLAALLRLQEPNDAHRITASMSFRQKVILFCELYPTRNSGMLSIDVTISRKALLSAEEFRNSVVHSFWYISGSDSYKWMRSKSSLRTPRGFNIKSGEANMSCLESGAEAINTIKDFYLGSRLDVIKQASTTLEKCIKTLSLEPNQPT